MKAHVIEASEQCGRLSVPKIKPITPLKEALENWPEDRLLLFGDQSLTSPSLATLDIDPHQPKAFLVGPEGGFTAQKWPSSTLKGKESLSIQTYCELKRQDLLEFLLHSNDGLENAQSYHP